MERAAHHSAVRAKDEDDFQPDVQKQPAATPRSEGLTPRAGWLPISSKSLELQK